MRELGALREGWAVVEAEETRLLRSMTVQEGVQQWLALQRAFEPPLQQMAALFALDRLIPTLTVPSRQASEMALALSPI